MKFQNPEVLLSLHIPRFSRIFMEQVLPSRLLASMGWDIFEVYTSDFSPTPQSYKLGCMFINFEVTMHIRPPSSSHTLILKTSNWTGPSQRTINLTRLRHRWNFNFFGCTEWRGGLKISKFWRLNVCLPLHLPKFSRLPMERVLTNGLQTSMG